MTPQQQALEILLTHPLFARILGPHYKREHGGSIQWHALNYGVLSGGEKGAITWAYAIWCDVSPTSQGEQKYWRDPFDGFAPWIMACKISYCEPLLSDTAGLTHLKRKTTHEMSALQKKYPLGLRHQGQA